MRLAASFLFLKSAVFGAEKKVLRFLNRLYIGLCLSRSNVLAWSDPKSKGTSPAEGREAPRESRRAARETSEAAELDPLIFQCSICRLYWRLLSKS